VWSSSDETWMLNKLGKSFMHPMPHTTVSRAVKVSWQLQQVGWSSYSKLVDLCVWVLVVCYQKLKFFCIMIFRDEVTVVPIEMSSWVSRTNALHGSLFDFTLLDIFWSNVTEHIYIRTFDLLLTEGHSKIEHVFGPALFWYFTQHKFVIPFWYLG
jgi:hypothetical protein